MRRVPERPIYLDHHSTTPVDPRVAAAMVEAMTAAFGNPNSTEHVYGEEAAAAIAEARAHIAALVDAPPNAVQFTTGATEAIALALRHVEGLHADRERPIRIGVSTVEHRAVLSAARALEARGSASLIWIPVDATGRLDLEAVDRALASGLDLLCLMAANNEVGTIYPVDAVSSEAHRLGCSVFVDATQAAGKIPLSVSDWGIDYLALSAHKMYGPKGVGALVHAQGGEMVGRSREGTGQGTPPVPGIVGLGEACRLRVLEMKEDETRIAGLRDQMERSLCEEIPGLVVNGDRANRLAGNLHISVPDVPGDAVIARLRRQVALSTGAACSSGAQEPSHVLRAMGLAPAIQEGALRIGLGKFTTEDDVVSAASAIAATVSAIRAVNPAAV